MVSIYYFYNIKPCITWQNSMYYPILKGLQTGFPAHLKGGCKYRWLDAVIYVILILPSREAYWWHYHYYIQGEGSAGMFVLYAIDFFAVLIYISIS